MTHKNNNSSPIHTDTWYQYWHKNNKQQLNTKHAQHKLHRNVNIKKCIYVRVYEALEHKTTDWVRASEMERPKVVEGERRESANEESKNEVYASVRLRCQNRPICVDSFHWWFCCVCVCVFSQQMKKKKAVVLFNLHRANVTRETHKTITKKFASIYKWNALIIHLDFLSISFNISFEKHYKIY